MPGKWKSVLVVTVALVTASGSSIGRAAVTAAAWPYFHNLLTIGDELSSGYDASAFGSTYGTKLADAVGARSWGTYEGFASCQGQSSGKGFAADLVIVELGTECTDMANDAFTAFYDGLLGAIARYDSSTAQVVCLGVWADQASRATMDVDIQGVCSAHGGLFVSLGPIFDDPTLRVATGTVTPWETATTNLWPSDGGHAAIAEAVASALGVTTSLSSATLSHPTGWPYHHAILTLGDSISYGYDASRLGATYVDEVANAAGTSRRGNVGALSHCNRSAAIPRTYDLVIVELGTDCKALTTSDFTTFFDNVLAQVVAANPSAEIVCMGVWGRPARRAAFDPTISTECSAHGGVFVSEGSIFDQPLMHIAPGSVTPWETAPDDFHPNDAGHAALAHAVNSALGIG